MTNFEIRLICGTLLQCAKIIAHGISSRHFTMPLDRPEATAKEVDGMAKVLGGN